MIFILIFYFHSVNYFHYDHLILLLPLIFIQSICFHANHLFSSQFNIMNTYIFTLSPYSQHPVQTNGPTAQ
jgi:hypothetical protein